MKEWIKKHQNMCLGLLVAFIIVFSPIFVNLLMNVTCSWASNEPNDWLGFWGSYFGAIGSFVMALIAYYALRKSNEQLEYIKKQNRPYLFASIRKALHQKETQIGDCPSLKRTFFTHTYYLSVVNHGNVIANDVKFDINCSNSDMLKESGMGAIISEINNTRIVIPPKIEKNYVLMVYSNNPNFTREQKKDQNQLFDSFVESNFGVSITYSWDFGKDQYKDTLYVKNTMTDATTLVQMLDYIDNSIEKLNATIIAIGEVKEQ
jgi:hypothetical protein